MSGVSLPVTRPTGQAMIVCNPESRPEPCANLQSLGYEVLEGDDPYAAVAELCRRPMVYRALILSLASLYREELPLIRTIKRRLPQIEIWLTHTDGRGGALADAMRFGADGLLAEDGLHRIAVPADRLRNGAGFTHAPVTSAQDPAAHPECPEREPSREPRGAPSGREPLHAEPVLTSEELRALLQEQPSSPPVAGD